jgi:hypothetical protein
VIQDVLATGGLKDILLFFMKDRTTDLSSNDNDKFLIDNKAVNLTKELEITEDCAKTSCRELEGCSTQYLHFRDDWNAQSCHYDEFKVLLLILKYSLSFFL